MDNIFDKEAYEFVIPYLNDIVVFSSLEEEHNNHLNVVFGKLMSAGIALNKEEVSFF